MSKVGKWVCGLSDESFGGEFFKTKEDAIEYGVSVYGGEGFYVGQVTLDHFNNISFSVYRVLEDISENLYDDVGDVVGDYLHDLPDGVVEELEHELITVIENWMDRHNKRPNFFTVENVSFVDIDDNGKISRVF